MTSCEHIVWLQTVNIKKLQFWEDSQIKQVIQKMLNPIAQYSSFIFFVSQKVKNIALCELFSYNNIKWGHCDGFINLWIDNVTIHSDHSIWFANSDSLLQSTSSSDAAICHESKTYSVCWKPSSEYSMFDVVHAQLFFLFTDMICIFVNDFDDLKSIAECLIAWAVIDSAFNLSKLTQLRVIVVTSADSSSLTHNILKTENFHFNLQQHSHQTILSFFSSITLFYLLRDHLSQLTQHCELRENILKQAEKMWDIHSSSQNLFSALHLHHLYKKVMLHTTEIIMQQFSFLLAAQEVNTLWIDLKNYLLTFMKLEAWFKLPYDALTLHIALSLLMNAYLPDMHCEPLTDPSLFWQFDWMFICWLCNQSLTLQQCFKHSISHCVFRPFECLMNVNLLQTFSVSASKINWVPCS